MSLSFALKLIETCLTLLVSLKFLPKQNLSFAKKLFKYLALFLQRIFIMNTSLVSLIILSFSASLSYADFEPQGYCFSDALKYMNLVHDQKVKDLDLDLDDLGHKKQPVKYSITRPKLDNFEENFEFIFSYGSEDYGYNDYKYEIKADGWIDAENKAHICDITGLKFSVEARY